MKRLIIPAFFVISVFFPALAHADASSTPNLILNSQVETVDSVDSTMPQDWLKGAQWGTNVPTYEYATTSIPDSDISSGNALSVSFDNYVGPALTGGDAKWYFTPVPVTAGRLYNYNDSYTSVVPTYLIAEFFDAAHVHLSYGGFFTLPATPLNVWKASSATFTAPAGAAYMTVFHSIQDTGKLITDSYSLTEVPLPTAFDNGFVSFTFDDGYVDHLTNAMAELNTAGVKGTFYVISHVSGFSITNPSFENMNGSGLPVGWTFSGTPTSFGVYPATGHTGAKAAQVTASTTNSQASWNFTPVTILADEDIAYSEYYKSTTLSDIYVEINTITGTKEYVDSTGAVVSTKTAFMTNIPASPDWTKLDINFYLPPESKSVTVSHTLVGIGSLIIDDVTLGAFTDFLNPDQVKLLQSNGHEVGGHTQTHANLTAIPSNELVPEISEGRNDLITGGITPNLSFAYPYGNFNEATKQIAKDAGYTSARTVFEGLNGKNSDRYALLSKSVNMDTTVAQVKAWIDDAMTQKRWLILVFHQIETNLTTPYVLTYGTTPANLAEILAYVNTVHAPVLTVAQGVALMDGYVNPTPNPVAPSIQTLADIIAEAASSTGANVTYTLPTAHDSANNALIAVCNPISGTMFALGTTSVSCTATDSNSLSTSTAFNIIVRDTTAPVVTVPNNIEISLNSGAGVNVFFFGINAADNYDGSITPVCSISSGSLFTASSTPVTCTATDAHGNAASSTFSVLINFTQNPTPSPTPSVSPDPTPTPTPTPSNTPGTGMGGGSSYGSGGGSSFGGGRFYTIFDFNNFIINLGNKGIHIPGDFNYDGVVDILDFNVLIMGWLK